MFFLFAPHADTEMVGADCHQYSRGLEVVVEEITYLGGHPLLYLRLLFKLGDTSKQALQATTNALKTYYNPEQSS